MILLERKNIALLLANGIITLEKNCYMRHTIGPDTRLLLL
jgi:hypothetical protein